MGTREMFWRTLFNAFCQRAHERYDYDALINGGRLDTRFHSNSQEDRGIWKRSGMPSS